MVKCTACYTPKGVIQWTDDQIKKNWELYKEHKRLYRCKDCMKKHLLLVEGYALENAQATGKALYIKIAQKARKERKRIA